MNKKELEKLGEVGSPRIYVALEHFVERDSDTTLNEEWVSKYIGKSWKEIIISQYMIKYMLVYVTFGDSGCNRPFGVVFKNGIVVAIDNGFGDIRSKQKDVVDYLMEKLKTYKFPVIPDYEE